MMQLARSTLVSFCFSLGLVLQATAADIPIPLQKPILLTSLGQAADVNTCKVLAQLAKVRMDYKPLANGEDIQGMKTVIISVGAAGGPCCGLEGGKVFGESCIDIAAETARGDEIFSTAKNMGIYTIVIHIGGAERRDNVSDLLLAMAVPRADAVIVYRQGNKDAYFERLAGDRPIISLKINMELVTVLKRLTAVQAPGFVGGT